MVVVMAVDQRTMRMGGGMLFDMVFLIGMLAGTLVTQAVFVWN